VERRRLHEAQVVLRRLVSAERDERAIGHPRHDGGAARGEFLLRLRAQERGDEKHARAETANHGTSGRRIALSR
jgi:hypothetical protein